jgi:hypothetical protein
MHKRSKAPEEFPADANTQKSQPIQEK